MMTTGIQRQPSGVTSSGSGRSSARGLRRMRMTPTVSMRTRTGTALAPVTTTASPTATRCSRRIRFGAFLGGLGQPMQLLLPQSRNGCAGTTVTAGSAPRTRWNGGASGVDGGRAGLPAQVVPKDNRAGRFVIDQYSWRQWPLVAAATGRSTSARCRPLGAVVLGVSSRHFGVVPLSPWFD